MKRSILLLLVSAVFSSAEVSAQIPGLGDLQKAVDKVSKTAKDASRVVKGVEGLSLAEEVAIGDAVAVDIVSRYGGVWRDEAATRRVNLIGQVLARYATRQDLTWHFGLLDSDSINAFSAPGGRVFITRALYQLADSDDKLAGVLAHEIVHIDERHAVNIIARGELLGGISALVADNNSSYAAYEQAVGSVSGAILDQGFDPGVEYKADGGGRELAATSGFAAGGLRAVIIQIDGMEGQPEEVFSTHPSTENRLKRLPDDPVP